MCRMHEKAAIKYLKDGNPQLALFQLKSILKVIPARWCLLHDGSDLEELKRGKRFQNYADQLNHNQWILNKMNYHDAEKEMKEDNKFLQQMDELSGRITGYE